MDIREGYPPKSATDRFHKALMKEVSALLKTFPPDTDVACPIGVVSTHFIGILFSMTTAAYGPQTAEKFANAMANQARIVARSEHIETYKTCGHA